MTLLFEISIWFHCSFPSPKRSRRDGKPATERVTSNPNLEIGENADSDKKKRPRLRDALPLEPHSDSKLDSVAEKRDSEKKSNGLHEGTKKSSNTTDLPRSRSYLQVLCKFCEHFSLYTLFQSLYTCFMNISWFIPWILVVVNFAIIWSLLLYVLEKWCLWYECQASSLCGEPIRVGQKRSFMSLTRIISVYLVI